jgi:hypothetical protein
MELTMQFVGGPLDGTLTFQTPPTDPSDEILLAWAVYKLTDDGTVGKSAMGASPAALATLRERGGEEARKSGARAHKYKIVERREDAGHIFVKAESIE